LKFSLTPSKVLNSISPLPRIYVNKTTKKQQATVLTSTELSKNKQELKEKAEREKRKVEGGPQSSSMNQKKQSLP
jgi:hypothetical protein